MASSPRVLLSLSAYACEGGFDGRHQPATCFSPVIALGRQAGPGDADGLWADYESVLELAAGAGVAGVCLELSWARLEPRRGRRDPSALARYAEVIDFARRRGLFVAVAAIDAAWPAWLGQEAWLMPWVVPVAIEYLSWLSSSLGADSWSIFAQRERLTSGFLDRRSGPPWRSGALEDERSAAHHLEMITQGAREGSVSWMTAAALELDDVADASGLCTDEIHVRSLVRGAGPLASARALVARRGAQWVLVDEEVPLELRR